QQVEVTVRALSAMNSAIAQNVDATPDAFDANDGAESRERATAKIMDDVAEQYVKKLAAGLRHKSGYIQTCGLWVHRSLITFLVYGLPAALALTLFIPMIFSPISGRFTWGIIGLL